MLGRSSNPKIGGREVQNAGVFCRVQEGWQLCYKKNNLHYLKRLERMTLIYIVPMKIIDRIYATRKS